MDGSGSRQHVVMFPFMAQGHLIPFLRLARLLARRTPFLTVTIVNTPLNVKRLQPQIESARQAGDGSLDIRLAELPFCSADHGLPPDSENTDRLPYHLIVTLMEASEHLEGAFDRFICQMSKEEGRLPLCIISDMFLGWTLDVAERFGIPRITFCTCGAYATALLYSLWRFLPHTRTNSPHFVLPDLPHVSLHRSQLCANLQMTNESDPCCRLVKRQFQRNLRSWGTLFNTFDALERDFLDHMRNITGRPVWSVGPVLSSTSISARPRGVSDLDEAGASCVEWLDGKPKGSVVYVSFGSQSSIWASQMKELAAGLERSQRGFVWVVRPPLDVGGASGSSFLPEGFEERMSVTEQGLVVRGWVPQSLILSHPSIGGFLSHCGWNSVMESLSHGVPIIGWPLKADQFYNSKLLSEKVGVCVEMKRGIGGELKKEEVARMVRLLMENERGVKLRKAATETRQAIWRALDDGQGEGETGSSIRHIDGFLSQLISNIYN